MVVELIATGMRNKEIAAALRISEDTAEVHIRNIFAKLNVQRPDRRRDGRAPSRDHPFALRSAGRSGTPPAHRRAIASPGRSQLARRPRSQ